MGKNQGDTRISCGFFIPSRMFNDSQFAVKIIMKQEKEKRRKKTKLQYNVHLRQCNYFVSKCHVAFVKVQKRK